MAVLLLAAAFIAGAVLTVALLSLSPRAASRVPARGKATLTHIRELQTKYRMNPTPALRGRIHRARLAYKGVHHG